MEEMYETATEEVEPTAEELANLEKELTKEKVKQVVVAKKTNPLDIVYEYPKGYSTSKNPHVTLDELIASAVEQAVHTKKKVPVVEPMLRTVEVKVPEIKTGTETYAKHIRAKAEALTAEDLKDVSLKGALTKNRYSPEIYMRVLLDYGTMTDDVWCELYDVARTDYNSLTCKLQALTRVLLSLGIPLRNGEVNCCAQKTKKAAAWFK